ncbi:carboxypeptidase B-like [Leguminivora glycinivorella]|uniref:carboxypeptidase B-like n=1 Tax=Leguminivora glycinivorella TaxID=1035111 RepID=UPI00200C9713|nr:carboxypeptidase B-like [Leguminivora glycinivorella]
MDVYHITLHNEDDRDDEDSKKVTENLPFDDVQAEKRGNEVYPIRSELDEEADSLDIDLKSIQGRDHHAVSAAMYLLYQLIEHTDTQMDLLKKFRLWVIPVFNPDGYDYSMTFTQRREWKKNLQQSWELCDGRKSCKPCETYGFRCIVQPCYGVNLDRNFEYQWIPAEELRAEHPCGDLHAGPRQLSERETRALTTYLHEQKSVITTFIAFKEGDVLGVMYPYSHTRKKRAFDANYRKRASRAASAAFGISGRPYVAGQTSEFLPLYAGGIEDWIDGHLGIDNTYTIMMFRATDSRNAKLMSEHVVHEAFAAMDTLLLENTGGTLEIKALNPSAPLHSGAVNILPNLLIVPAAILVVNS